jgi:hypothetical protein
MPARELPPHADKHLEWAELRRMYKPAEQPCRSAECERCLIWRLLTDLETLETELTRMYGLAAAEQKG